jgi:subtilisin family serine protease
VTFRHSVGSSGSEHLLSRTPPRALYLAGIIPAAFVALLMLTTSFSFLAVPGSAVTLQYGHEGLSAGSDPVQEIIDPWKDKDWDWGSMADEDGCVRVIFSYTGATSGGLKALEADPAMVGLMGRLESGKLHEFSSALDGFSGRLSLEDLEAVLASPGLGVQAYPDFTVTAMLADSVAQIGADQLWSMRDPSNAYVMGTGMVVAVIDTGVDYHHPDLGGGIGPSYKVIGGYDFVNSDSDPMDDNGHGTHCAGIVAANGGLTGVAPGASILAYKSLDASGQGYMSNVIAAIDRAMDPNQDSDPSDRADVISMSLGGPGSVDDPVCVAVGNAVAAGIVVVVAAGNSGPSLGTVDAPGVAPDAVTVGAIDKSDNLAQFSSRGTIPSLSIKPEISAPGVSIVSTVPYSGVSMSSPTGYFSASGTSMATPHVAGGAALLLQMHPTWTPAQVKSALVTGAYDLDASLWAAGAGGMWLPDAAESRVFVTPALVSYGTAGDPSQTVAAFNSGLSFVAQTSSVDWSSLLANGSASQPLWTNASSVSPSSLTLPFSGTSYLTLQVQVPPTYAPEGYYDGEMRITSGVSSVSVPFGFAVLSRLSVMVTSMSGDDVNDPYGGVWVYRVPDCDVALGKRGSMAEPVPPATFLVPSGTYNVHSIGHQLLYDFADPYALTATVTVPRLSSLSVELSMATARTMTIDLETADGNPIYVKDFRVYFRYEGLRNVSFHVTGSDYSIKGSEIFTIPTSKTVYVSDTDAKIGISVSGFSYSAGMWDFMSRNWDHWFEYMSGVDTAFLVEASADLQYLMAWEFQGVGPSTPTALGLEEGQYSIYTTKYDIPGAIGDLWCNWGTHRAQGGDAAFFVRRDTDTSLNPFFTGMTRATIVRGVFSELYYPGNLFRGFIERAYYTPDYDHLLRANTAAEVYLPDRNFITPLEAESVFERIGTGPFYPAMTTFNTNSTLVLVQPLLRDQSGAKVGGMSMPTMDLYRNGMVVGMYQFPEYLARPDGLRVVNLASSGQYMAKINYAPFPQISSNVQMTLGFTVPATDVNPPRLLGMAMPQRFVPGSSVGLTLSTADDRSAVAATISWRASSASQWQALSVTSQGSGMFSTTIPTSSSDSAIHLLVRATDQAGNYLEFTMDNAALAQIPVTFSLSSSETEVGYRDGDASVVLTGVLTDLSGNPLCSAGAIPLELVHEGQKIGMILDEYSTSSTHTHNGSIRFEWHFNPANIFSGPSETAEIDVVFDLGIYQQAARRLTLTSIPWSNLPPEIALLSPANSSLNAAGTKICLSITDDGSFTVQANLDGVPTGQLSSPWEVDTSSWSDGRHYLRVVATDSYGTSSSATFAFDIDASDPAVSILYPAPGARVPAGAVVQASVYDAYLSQVTYRLDGGLATPLSSPYTIDMADWPEGEHTVEILAVDSVGKVGSDSRTFELSSSTAVVQVLSPADGSVVRSGVSIDLSAEGIDPLVVRWSEGGVWHDLGSQRFISTSGWSEGMHNILINVTDSMNGFDQISFTITIDDTVPLISLLSPQDGAFVSKTDTVRVSVLDANFASANWTIWGIRWRSVNPELYISLASSPGDGYFTIQIATVDLAGNQAQASYTFAMDSSPPAISIANVASGGAIRPGTPIDAVVSDAFLASVQYSLDSAPMSVLSYPHDIDISSLGNGFHRLEIVAQDLTGKTTDLEMPFYVDAMAPLLVLTTSTEFVEGSTHTITAEASDDFGVFEVILYCQLPSGTFVAVPMDWDGTTYSVVLMSTMLWDGMGIYAVATDQAGNSADTPEFTLSAGALPVDGDSGGTDQTDLLTGPSTLVSSGLMTITIIGSLMAVLFAFVALSSRGRPWRVSTTPTPADMGITSRPGDRSGPSAPSPVREAKPSGLAEAGEGGGAGGQIVVKDEEETKPAPPARSDIRTEQRPRTVPLFEAIPDMPLRPSAEADGEGNDIDYGELIERELILPGREGSVFKEEMDEPPRTDFELLREIMDDLGRLGPKKPTI